MPAFGRSAVFPAILVASMATVAGAQSKCDIDEGTPSQIARATLAWQLAAQATKPEDAQTKLREAVKLLSEADKARNPLGRNMLMGRVLVLWMSQPNIGATPKRGTIGFTTNIDQPIDLIASIDSAFSVVEQAQPDCVSQTASWRQQKGWVDLVNGAIELMNQDKVDSAVAVAKRSLMLYRGAPYAYMVL